MRMVPTKMPQQIRYRQDFVAAFEVTEPNRQLGESRVTYFQDVMDWCYEQFGNGQSLVDFEAFPRRDTSWVYSAVTVIIVKNPDHAFEFKMRWC